MKGQAPAVVALAVCIVFALVAGCEEQNATETQSNVRLHQLIAAENMELKKELEGRERELQQREEEIEKQKGLVAKCEEQKEQCKERLAGKVREQVDAVLVPIMEKNAELQAEIKTLKAEIEKLEGELEKVREQVTPKPRPLGEP